MSVENVRSGKLEAASFSFGVNNPKHIICSGNGICKVSSNINIEPDALEVKLDVEGEALSVTFMNIEKIKSLYPEIYTHFNDISQPQKGYSPDDEWKPVELTMDEGIMALFPGYITAIIEKPLPGEKWPSLATFKANEIDSLVITVDTIALG